MLPDVQPVPITPEPQSQFINRRAFPIHAAWTN
jgi:hypothetical protein